MERGFDDQTSLSVPSVLDLVGSFSAVIHRWDKVIPIGREVSFFWPATAYTCISTRN